MYFKISREEFHSKWIGSINGIGGITESKVEEGELDIFSSQERIWVKNNIINHAWMGEIGKDNCGVIFYNKTCPKYEDCSIWKLKDEWFVVNISSSYYKCDQWDGLLNLLKWSGID